MTRLICLAFAFVACAALHAQDSVSYSLEQCISLAIKNNLDVKRSEFQLERSTASLWQARTLNLPYITAYASQGINQGKSINPYTNTYINQEIMTGQYGINSGMVLWNGFSNFNTMRQNAFNKKASEYDLAQARLDISIAVTLAYLQVLSNEELLKQAASQVATSKAQVERLGQLWKNDAIAPDTYHNTKGQLASDRLNYTNAKAALASSKLDLARLLNTDLPDNARFEPVNVSGSTQENTIDAATLFDKASLSFGSVKAAEYRRLSTLKSVHAARGMMLPTLSLNGSIGTNYSDAALAQKVTGVSDASTDNYVVVNNSQLPVYAPQYTFSSTKIPFSNQFKNNLNSYVGLSVQFTLFNSLRNRTRLEQAKIDHAQTELQAQTVNTVLKQAIKQAHINMKAAYERYTILQEQVADFSASFKVATTKFEKGAITAVDYMIAKTNNDRAALNLIAAKYDYALKSKILDYYSGAVK